MNDNLRLLAQTIQAARRFLEDEGFIEVETVLTRSTRKGPRLRAARRVCGGEWFALPQSPQLFKQLLMVGGIERYTRWPAVFATKTCGRPPAGIHPAGHRDELHGSGADPAAERSADLLDLEGGEGHRTAAALPAHDLA